MAVRWHRPIEGTIKTVRIVCKAGKGYACFACATLTSKTIRVGLDLGDRPFDDTVQKARSLGAMPNLTHMVEISTSPQVNDGLIGLVEAAHREARKK